MLTHTFCHIPGIGRKLEQGLWQAGITSWESWCNPLPLRLSALTRLEAQRILHSSHQALDNEPCFFSNRLENSETWRLFPHFRHVTAYLDIETTGLGNDAEITTIALYDGQEVFTFVNGRNLEEFVDAVARFQVLVTYNGKGFDIPFLERFFRIKLPQAQIDLRFVLARLGFKGGLKGCERMLGLSRGLLDGVDGLFAVRLWYHYLRTGDERALQTLLAYNVEDTVNLERLMVEAYNRNILTTPFGDELLSFPEPPALPFAADLHCIDTIKRTIGY